MDPTFITDKLHTNYVPSISEVEKIRHLIAKPQRERSCLEEKIARFQIIVDDLCTQRDKLDAHIQDHLALVSGARRLPHDVVQEIFSHCLPTERNAVMSATEAPVLLGRICSGWRRIALSTPDLWSTLHLPIPNCHTLGHCDKWRHVAEAVKSWLNRSGGLPLSLSVACTSLNGRQPDRKSSLGISYFMNTLTRHSHRWERIDFLFPFPELASSLSSLTEADVPLLKSAILECSIFNDIAPTNNWPLIGIFSTPSIREVSLLGFKHSEYLHPLPWGQLTGLYLERGMGLWGESLTETDALNILEQCPILTTCKLMVDANPIPLAISTPPQTVTLSRLRSLIIVEGAEAELTRQFFGRLKLPALRYLGFRRLSLAVGHGPLHISRILADEGNPVEELELGLESISPIDLTDCLEFATTIKRLTLTVPDRMWGYPANPALTDYTLSLFNPDSSEEQFCPLLEEISINSCRDLSDEKILRFLQERTNAQHVAGGMSKLKRASFTINRLMTTDILPDVQPLIAGGLKLDLQYCLPILESDTDIVDVPDGPRLRVNYVAWAAEEKISPWRGLRTQGKMRTLN
jgi:hypothetical protein